MHSDVERKYKYLLIASVLWLEISLVLFLFYFGNIYLMVAILLGVYESFLLTLHFRTIIITKAKYTDCKWNEYSTFVNSGVTWIGSRAYLFKGIPAKLEQMECDLALGNFKSVANDISNIDSLLRTRKISKYEKNRYQRRKCQYYYEIGNHSMLQKEADVARTFVPEGQMIMIDIYQNLLEGDQEGAKTKLRSMQLTYNYDIVFWHYLMAQSENDFGRQKGHWKYVEELGGDTWFRKIAIKKIDELNNVTVKDIDKPQLRIISHKPIIIRMVITFILIIVIGFVLPCIVKQLR